LRDLRPIITPFEAALEIKTPAHVSAIDGCDNSRDKTPHRPAWRSDAPSPALLSSSEPIKKSSPQAF
jgi:hypothetical protein